MATIKSYTDLQQSKKLAEILPIETADMHYWLAWRGDVSKEKRNTPKVGTPNKDAIKTYWCPCWSLAALLDVLPIKLQIILAINYFHGYKKEKYVIGSLDNDKYDCYADNPVDACYEMILQLHELKML